MRLPLQLFFALAMQSVKLLLWAFLVCAHGVAMAAGYQRLEVPGAGSEPAIPIIVWTPCAAGPATSQLGPYVLQAVQNCAVSGESLPLVAISHGHGGSFLGHHDTAVALADAGFVVVSLNHPGDSYGDESSGQSLKIFETRPRDVSRAITFMLANWQHRQRLDKAFIGVFGFSRGGYTALALVGATPSIAASSERFCAAWWSLAMSICRQLKGSKAKVTPQADQRVRAAVVVDPLNLFDESGLKKVTVPLQLWASEYGGAGVELSHVQALRSALTPVPEYHVAKGAGHFAYLAPCSPALAESASQICKDPEGFDRTGWHRTMNAAVVEFFARQLKKATGNSLPRP
jgi:predicted dienelactone hydrolase